MSRRETRHQANHRQSHVMAPVDHPVENAASAAAVLPAAVRQLHAGKLQESEALCRQVLKARPDHHAALHLLGVVMHRMGRMEAAVEFIGKAVALRPEYAEAHNGLGNVLAEMGRLEEAAAAYRMTVAVKPGYAEAHCNLGTTLSELGELDEAAAALEKAIALKPDLAQAHNNLGIVLHKEHKFDEAVAACQKAVALDPNLAGAHNNLGIVLLKWDKAAEAVAWHRKAIELKPNLAEAHYHLGRAFKDLGKREEATACFQKAIALKPDFSNAHFRYAMVHEFVPGDPEIDKLKELLEREAISENERATILFALGKAHDDIGRYAEAMHYYSGVDEEGARRPSFDPSHHRNQLMAIKDVFRERHGSVHGASGDAERVPIFVVGMPRSGKTSVESLLAQHESVYGASESMEWHNALMAVLNNYSISEPFPECMRLLSDDHVRETGKIYMANIVKRSPNSKLFINTKSHHFPYIGMIIQALPTAKVIYCNRDAMDNCWIMYISSMTSKNSYDLRGLASYFTFYKDMMAHWQRLYGDRILSVRYEDLVRNPAHVGAQIYQFCGLDYDPKAVRHRFTTDEIGHWKRYERYLVPLRQALGEFAGQSDAQQDQGG